MSLRVFVYAARMSFRFVSFAVLWLLALRGPVSAQFAAFGEKAGAVKTSIVADTKAVEAGKPFTVRCAGRRDRSRSGRI